MRRVIFPLLALFVLAIAAGLSPDGAAAQTPPVVEDLRVSNVGGNAFTVTWRTLAPAGGQVNFGTAPDDLSRSAGDVRGDGTQSTIHFVVVSGLSPETTYYFEATSTGTMAGGGGGTVTTGPVLIPAPDAPLFGRVVHEDGSPAVEALVHLRLMDDEGEQSQPIAVLVGSGDQGYWQWVPTAARTEDLTAAFPFAESDTLAMSAVDDAGNEGTLDVTVADARNFPPPPLTVGAPPAAILLGGFEAVAEAGRIRVGWETLSEIDNLGFNLLRGLDPAAPQESLNVDLIPSQAPGSHQGFAYEWFDEGVQVGTTYYYWLEDVDVSGVITRHGPVAATYTGAPTAVRLQRLGVAARPGGAAAAAAAVATLAALLLGGVGVRRLRRGGAR